MRLKYALLSYHTFNLGDEIQSLAIRQFLPKVDYFVDRDRLNTYHFAKRPKLILNGWYTHSPHRWPPSEDLDALIVSFHISNEYGSSIEALTSPEAIRFYKKHEPVGCRDYFTRDLLISKGVDAYYSGCLTMTLKRDPKIPRGKEVLAVDVPETMLSQLVPSPEERAGIRRLTHAKRFNRKGLLKAAHWLIDPALKKFDFHCAAGLLRSYMQAKLVITTRLHCALPCLAMGTPVVFLVRSYDDPRFNPLAHYVKSHTFDEVASGGVRVDIHSPLPNPSDIRPLIDSLEGRIRAFLSSTKSMPKRERIEVK